MRGAIVDLDGTVYRGGSLLPGAAEGVERLRNAGLDVLFFSNNPIKDGTAYAASLTELGIPVSPEEACSAGVVTAAYLREHHADDAILLVGAAGLRDQFRAADLSLTADPDRADVLVASWTPEFDYDDMQAALDAIDEGTAFLGTDPDRTFPTEDGFVPGSGAITGAVAAVVGRDPDAVLGKPSDAALEFALDRLGAPPEECLVVGDRLDTDLAMGDRAGMTTVLVLTGVADREDLADSDVRPDYVIDRLGDVGSVLDDLARG
jgi:HAD superfamily hydrolase (TIGR01450 family)